MTHCFRISNGRACNCMYNNSRRVNKLIAFNLFTIFKRQSEGKTKTQLKMMNSGTISLLFMFRYKFQQTSLRSDTHNPSRNSAKSLCSYCETQAAWKICWDKMTGTVTGNPPPSQLQCRSFSNSVWSMFTPRMVYGRRQALKLSDQKRFLTRVCSESSFALWTSESSFSMRRGNRNCSKIRFSL